MAIAHILAVISAAFFGAPQAVTLSNGLVARDFVAGREWKTVALRCAADGWTVQVDSDELEVELTDGTVITGAEWTLVGSPKHSRRGDTQSLTVALETEKVPGLQATVRYWVRDNEAWMRKQVELRGEPQKTISRIDLEPMTLKLAVQDNSGTGMPILAGRCWFGVEYPGSQNALKKGRLSLVHFPGARLGSKSVASKVAVFGIAGPGQAISVAFENYLTTVITPPRDFTHYNSWYDLRGSELTPSRLLDTYREFQKVLLKPYGLKLAAFVIDDGWQDPKSIWRPRRDLYPEGFGPLARQLEAEGTRLGLWMPLSGQNLDVQWGVAQGYEKSSAGDFYCLAAPRYFAAIRDATARLIREGNLAYYKHDFNHLRCSAPGHQHLPD
ncbi:MAG: hypothetical protein H5T86_15845, partial [Armatimonadetes bacterium]|nr:hypothetical protein [Armatimonadota bacterium]